jgi:hypothetical protein
MFGLGPATKIHIAVEGVDMRKGFDGLFGLVRDRLGQDPLSELAMLINGLDLAEARPRKNWLRRLPAAARNISLVYVRKRLAITRSLTYHRPYSRGLRSPTPHRNL